MYFSRGCLHDRYRLDRAVATDEGLLSVPLHLTVNAVNRLFKLYALLNCVEALLFLRIFKWNRS